MVSIWAFEQLINITSQSGLEWRAPYLQTPFHCLSCDVWFKQKHHQPWGKKRFSSSAQRKKIKEQHGLQKWNYHSPCWPKIKHKNKTQAQRHSQQKFIRQAGLISWTQKNKLVYKTYLLNELSSCLLLYIFYYCDQKIFIVLEPLTKWIIDPLQRVKCTNRESSVLRRFQHPQFQDSSQWTCLCNGLGIRTLCRLHTWEKRAAQTHLNSWNGYSKAV